MTASRTKKFLDTFGLAYRRKVLTGGRGTSHAILPGPTCKRAECVGLAAHDEVADIAIVDEEAFPVYAFSRIPCSIPNMMFLIDFLCAHGGRTTIGELPIGLVVGRVAWGAFVGRDWKRAYHVIKWHWQRTVTMRRKKRCQTRTKDTCRRGALLELIGDGRALAAGCRAASARFRGSDRAYARSGDTQAGGSRP